ncbi:Uma2 family endonuclease [Dolichospermum sp. UHCC 0259]|uniref:Uma2 family endonuclease n=1 Tax=Dolichospermum sp. UHCC 0259 TaxID=2590010 RepID=UPI001447A4DE|nr:Uma2 family endonuclease [Dolichospermum sp. UHCC 0259]MTJ49300.1 Uma2 family endonuclease [Dolichospermum sp. UHCC 0259]
MNTVTLNLDPVVRLTDDQFYQLCMANKDVNLELNAQGELIIVPPVGGESGRSESDLNFKVSLWNYKTQLGIVFSSSTVFRLPNGAKRSPDVAWVKLDRWEALTVEEREKFPPLAPDFVIELRSKTDRLKTLQEKCTEYINNGVRLCWLINPYDKQVEIYRLEQPVEIVQFPVLLSGEDVLLGFELQF